MKKTLKLILIPLVSVLVIYGVFITFYLINYLTPLSTYNSIMANVEVKGETNLIPRSAIEKMLTYSKQYNPEHYKKYKKVLWLPLPAYPMTTQQQTELGWFATDEEQTRKTFEGVRHLSVELPPLSFSY